MHAKAIFKLPFAFEAYHALVDVRCNIRMYVQVELSDAYLVDELVNLSFQLVGKQNARLNFSRTVAGRAGLLDVDIHGGSHALSGDLHQSELAKWQDVVSCAVFLHVFAHALVEHLSVFRQVHVDEVHYDDSSHIT